eukprot:Clim_evm17s243 gene=Clim_evmTU17s243
MNPRWDLELSLPSYCGTSSAPNVQTTMTKQEFQMRQRGGTMIEAYKTSAGHFGIDAEFLRMELIERNRHLLLELQSESLDYSAKQSLNALKTLDVPTVVMIVQAKSVNEIQGLALDGNVNINKSQLHKTWKLAQKARKDALRIFSGTQQVATIPASQVLPKIVKSMAKQIRKAIEVNSAGLSVPAHKE